MQIKSSVFKIKGMRKDDSYSSFNPEYSWSNKNIRLTARDGNDLLSVTNERGNSRLLFNDITPEKLVDYTYTCLFGNYLLEQVPTAYTYNVVFDNYLAEQSDGWVPPVDYTYEFEFNNYLLEQENI